MFDENYFRTRDGLRLHYEIHTPPNPKAIIVVLHGLNEHVGRYRHVAERFSGDFKVCLLDQRGHGASDGVKSYVNSFLDYVADVDEFLSLVKKKSPGKNLFLIAHSMGGQVALNYLADFPNHPVAGFITSSPNIRVGWRINPIKRALGMKAARWLPKLKMPGEVDPKWISHDAAVVADYKSDPLVPQYVTLGLASEVLLNQELLLSKASRISIPALMLHGGDDRISSPQGSRDFFAKLASADKTLKIYDGLYHEIFNEIGKEAVFDDVVQWLLKRVR